MAEIRRRRVSATTASKVQPASRRRDRVAAEPDEDEEEETEIEATRRPARTRSAAAPVRRVRRVEPEEDELDDEDEDEEEEEEEIEEEPAPPRRVRSATPKSRRAPVEDAEEDEEDDEPPARSNARHRLFPRPGENTRRRRAPVEDEDEDERPARRSRRGSGAEKPPPGIRLGLEGAEETAKSGGGGVNRLKLGTDPTLIKVLENKPLASFRQHWVPQGRNQADRPYTCIEKNCPLCEIGLSASKQFVFNVLDLSSEELSFDDDPPVKILNLSVKPYEAFKVAATPRGETKPNFTRGFWAVSKSGSGQRTQTNFNPVKDRDLEEDWREIFEAGVAPDELPELIAEAKQHLFDWHIVQTQTRGQLLEVARYLADEEEV